MGTGGTISYRHSLEFEFGDNDEAITKQVRDCAALDHARSGQVNLEGPEKNAILTKCSHSAARKGITFNVNEGLVTVYWRKAFSCDGSSERFCPKCRTPASVRPIRGGVCPTCHRKSTPWRIPLLISVLEVGEMSPFECMRIIRVHTLSLCLFTFVMASPLLLGARKRARLRRRFRDCECPRCGYSLVGSVSMACPECGTPIDPKQLERIRGINPVSTNPTNQVTGNQKLETEESPNT